MCVLRALFTVCTLPDLICRGLSSITFIYKKRIIYANTCHNVAIHIVISYISSNFTQLTTSKFSKSPQNTIDIFLHPCDEVGFFLIRTYSLKLNFCSHCIESYHKSISNISNKLLPAKVHHNLFNLE